MSTIITGKQLINYSKDKLEKLIKPGTIIKHCRNENPIVLTGKEIVVLAMGGELLVDETGHDFNLGKKEPAGIILLDGSFIGICSIIEIEI